MVGGHVEVSMCLVACFSDTPFKKLCSLRCENFLSRCWQFLHISRCCRENLANLCGNTWISIPVGQKNMGGCALDNQGLVLVFCVFWIGLGLLWVGFGLDGACFGVACGWLWFCFGLLWVGLGVLCVGSGLV